MMGLVTPGLSLHQEMATCPRCTAFLVRDCLHRFEYREGLVGEVIAAEAPRFQAVAAVFGGLVLVAAVLAREEAAREG